MKEGKSSAAEGSRGKAPRLGEMELLVVGRWRMCGLRVRTVDVVEGEVVRAVVREVRVGLVGTAVDNCSVWFVDAGDWRDSSAVCTLHVDEPSSS